MKVYCKMVEFKKGILGHITTSISRGITPSYTNNEGIYVVNQKCIRNGKISFDEIRISKEKLLSKEKIIEKTDTLICSTGVGTLGRVGRFNDFPENKIITADSHVTIVKADKKIVCPFYLSYVLISKQADIEGLAKGSTGQTELSKNELALLEIPLPPLDVQKRIAGILGALDDRIDVLRRENVVLEQMAQAVFQSWFVDFDIVRAKAAGTPESEVCEKYHITPELYALFPSALTPDNLPLGWEKKKLGELVQNIKKSVKPSMETEHKPYVPIDCITAKTLTLYDFKDGKEAQSSLISFESRDILFGAMRAYFHKVCIAPFAGTTRSTVFCLRPKAPKDFSFALLSIFQNRCISYASQNSKGTTMPYAVWDNNLSEYQTEASTEDMRVAFNEYLGNSFDKMMLNAQQIRALSATRDALLPKLMNGEIEV